MPLVLAKYYFEHLIAISTREFKEISVPLSKKNNTFTVNSFGKQTRSFNCVDLIRNIDGGVESDFFFQGNLKIE